MGFLDSLKKMFGGSGDAAPTAVEDAPAEPAAEAAPVEESSTEEENTSEM